MAMAMSIYRTLCVLVVEGYGPGLQLLAGFPLGLWALRTCDPHKVNLLVFYLSDAIIFYAGIHNTCTHDTCIHDTCIYDTFYSSKRLVRWSGGPLVTFFTPSNANAHQSDK